MKNDRQLEDDVRAELDWDPAINDPGAIAVAAYRGHVTLRGTLPSLHQRRTAVAAAKRVRGTFDVDDQLSVRLMDELAREDAELRGAVLQAFAWNVQFRGRRSTSPSTWVTSGSPGALTGPTSGPPRRTPCRRWRAWSASATRSR